MLRALKNTKPILKNGFLNTSIIRSSKAKSNIKNLLNLNTLKINNLAIIIAAKVLLTADKKVAKEGLGFSDLKQSVSEIFLSDAKIDLVSREIKKIDKKLQQAFSKEAITFKRDNKIASQIAETKAAKALKAISEASAKESISVSLPFVALNLLYAWFIEGDGFTKNKSSYSYFNTFSNYFAMLDIYESTELISFIGDQTVVEQAVNIVKKDLNELELELIKNGKRI